jgi:hypothetical protein
MSSTTNNMNNMNTNQLRMKTPDILDEEVVADRVNRIMAIGYDKTLREEERLQKITAVLEGRDEEEEEEEDEEDEEEAMVQDKVNRIIAIARQRVLPEEERLQKIEAIFQEALTTNGKSDAPRQLNEMKATTQEFLALAMREKKLPENIGVCGTVCNNSCQWCSEDEEEEEEEEEKNFCHTCGNQCVSYSMGDNQIGWLCEKCYNGENIDSQTSETGLDWNESGYCD